MEEERLSAALGEAEAPFRTLVEDAAWAHASMEGLVLDLGRWWMAGPDSRLVEQIAFSVAASEAVRTPGGVYVEGFVWADGQVRAAAWCGVGTRVVYGPRADAYLGVPLAPRFCRRVQQRTGAAAVLMSKDSKLLPMLRDGLPPDAILAGGSPGPRHS
ncbi:hypothetical protein [Nocardia sp. NRRL S-836]|uniref:hypothetical protein n=1 Tax=Nocardia sp. NRRL S-836 TaxID=1519492 RepID=UPI0012FBC8DA|nr:hypothetical protein [Nocardia sp. NRRL S-836]